MYETAAHSRFQVERQERRGHQGHQGATEIRYKRYLFWVIDVAKYYTSRHCVRSRVLDISIAFMELVLGYIVGELRISVRPWGEYYLLCG